MNTSLDKAKIAAIKAAIARTKGEAFLSQGAIIVSDKGSNNVFTFLHESEHNAPQHLDPTALKNGVIQATPCNPEDLPQSFVQTDTDTEKLPANTDGAALLQRYDLTDLARYASADCSRDILTKIHVDSSPEVKALWALDGHAGLLHYAPDSAVLPWTISIPAVFAAVLQTCKAIGPITSARLLPYLDCGAHKVALFIGGDGWHYWQQYSGYNSVPVKDTHTRRIELADLLPCIDKVIPEPGHEDRDGRLFSSLDCATIAAGYKAIQPFTNAKTVLAIMDRGRIDANFNAGQYTVSVPDIIPQSVEISAEGRAPIAVDAKLAEQVFWSAAVTGGDVEISIDRKSAISVIILRSGKTLSLIMPLRLLDEVDELSYWQWRDKSHTITFSAPKAKAATKAAPKAKAATKAAAYTLDTIAYALAALGCEVKDVEGLRVALDTAALMV
jgi:hypothetical protein